MCIRDRYNISKEKLSKPVYRNFEISKRLRGHDLDVLEENLDFIFKRGRAARIVDLGKMISLLDLEKSLKSDYREALEEIRLKLFEGRGIYEPVMMLVLSNDVVSDKEERKLQAKYILDTGKLRAYISSLKLHTIEYLEVSEKKGYDEIFEDLLELDSMVERIIEIQRKCGGIIKEGSEITPELLYEIERSEKGDREQRDVFKSYHHYLTNLSLIHI